MTWNGNSDDKRKAMLLIISQEKKGVKKGIFSFEKWLNENQSMNGL